MLEKTKSAELAAVLEWYRAMGVDQLVEDAPINWLARGDAPPGQRLQPPAAPIEDRQAVREPPAIRDVPARPTAPARQFPAAVPDAAVHSARAAARDAANLDELGSHPGAL